MTAPEQPAAKPYPQDTDGYCRACLHDPADHRHDVIQAFLLGLCAALALIVLLGLAGAF